MSQTAQTTYDLEERTAKFGEALILLSQSLAKNVISEPLIKQLIRSATSIGANYMEANNASSKKDFRNKIYIAKKEAQETKHWLRMLATAIPDAKPEIRELWQECHELTLILQAISKKLNAKKEV